MNNFEEILAGTLLGEGNRERGEALDDSGEGLDVQAANTAAAKRRKETRASDKETAKNLANFKPGPRRPMRHKDKETGVVTTTVRRGDTGPTAASLGRGQHTSPPDRKKNESILSNFEELLAAILLEAKPAGVHGGEMAVKHWQTWRRKNPKGLSGAASDLAKKAGTTPFQQAMKVGDEATALRHKRLKAVKGKRPTHKQKVAQTETGEEHDMEESFLEAIASILFEHDWPEKNPGKKMRPKHSPKFLPKPAPHKPQRSHPSTTPPKRKPKDPKFPDEDEN